MKPDLIVVSVGSGDHSNSLSQGGCLLVKSMQRLLVENVVHYDS